MVADQDSPPARSVVEATERRARFVVGLTIEGRDRMVADERSEAAGFAARSFGRGSDRRARFLVGLTN